MASHFRQPEDAPRPASPRGGRPRTGGNPRSGLATRRGGDESYHAPDGNPHAAHISDRAEGFVSVVSDPQGSSRGHDRRRREPRFVETDPYDLSGRRSRSVWKRLARVLSVLLFVAGVALIVGAAGLWLRTRWQYGEQERVNEELAAFVDVTESGSQAPQVDWEGLKAVNDEVVGWVQIPGTVVNFPVYQASDNEKYLHTSAEGGYTIGGQIFMDYENAAPGMVDAQTVIYGHHLRDGSMFKVISDLQEQDMFDTVSTVWYVTEAATYRLEPLLAYETTADDANVRRFSFGSPEELSSYLGDLLGRAGARRADASELAATATQVLTLCTCYYDDADKGRALLVCVPTSVEPAATEAATGQ